MSGDSPEQIRADIERTRDALSSNVDALADKVIPTRVVERRVERARDTLSSVKEKVMGASSDTTTGAAHAVSSAAAKLADTASTVADSATTAPQAARQQTRGNPLAAGLIAFGAGWLLSSLLPVSRSEQQIATTIKDTARDNAQLLTAPLSEAAHDLRDHLAEPAQQAVESVKSTASDAVSTVTEQASAAAGEVSDQASEANDHLTPR